MFEMKNCERHKKRCKNLNRIEEVHNRINGIDSIMYKNKFTIKIEIKLK